MTSDQYTQSQNKELFEIKRLYKRCHLNDQETFIIQIGLRYSIIIRISKAIYVTILKSIFTNGYKTQSVSTTKRIGRSMTLLLARILCQYLTEDRFIFFQNLNEFSNLETANTIIVQMIRHLWWDRLQRKDFKLLDFQIEKHLPQSSQNLQILKQIDQICQSLYSKIQSIQFEEQQKYDQSQTKKNQSLKIKFPIYGVKDLRDLIFFNNLLNLIQKKIPNQLCYLILDQFNFVGRMMYQIIGFKKKAFTSATVIQSSINLNLRQLALTNLFISKCGRSKIRFFSSIKNYSFQNMLYILKRSFNKQKDSYTVFGFSYSGQNAKYQLQFQLNQIYQKMDKLKRKKNTIVYSTLMKKMFINNLVDSLELALDWTSVRYLAQTLMNISSKQSKKQINKHLILLNKDIISKKDIQNTIQLGSFLSKLIQAVKATYEQQIKRIKENFITFFDQSLSNQQRRDKYLILALAAYIIQHTKNENIKLNLLRQYTRNLARHSKNVSKSENQVFFANLLSLIKFYYSLNGLSSSQMRFNFAYENIWSILIQMSYNQIGKAIDELTIEDFALKQIYEFHQKSSYQAIFGNKLEINIFDFLQKSSITKKQVFIGQQQFIIDQTEILQSHLNILEQTKNILSKIINKPFTKLIKCIQNEHATDDLIVRVIQKENKVIIQFLFIQIGINGQCKIKQTPKKFINKYFSQKSNLNDKTSLQKVKDYLRLQSTQAISKSQQIKHRLT